jgi:hypothetical protein
VEPELEAGDDPEVAAAAAQCPEQILTDENDSDEILTQGWFIN